MADLTKEQKRFVVIELAQGSTPQEVVESVKDEFGVEITRQRVRHYNPEQSDDVAQELAELFYEERERADEKLDNIGAARQSYRLKTLHNLLLAARKMRNVKPNVLGKMTDAPAKTVAKSIELEAKLLEQIARERGGAYGARQSAGKASGGEDGGGVAVEPTDVDYRQATQPLAPKAEAATE